MHHTAPGPGLTLHCTRNRDRDRHCSTPHSTGTSIAPHWHHTSTGTPQHGTARHRGAPGDPQTPTACPIWGRPGVSPRRRAPTVPPSPGSPAGLFPPAGCRELEPPPNLLLRPHPCTHNPPPRPQHPCCTPLPTRPPAPPPHRLLCATATRVPPPPMCHPDPNTLLARSAPTHHAASPAPFLHEFPSTGALKIAAPGLLGRAARARCGFLGHCREGEGRTV